MDKYYSLLSIYCFALKWFWKTWDTVGKKHQCLVFFHLNRVQEILSSCCAENTVHTGLTCQMVQLKDSLKGTGKWHGQCNQGSEDKNLGILFVSFYLKTTQGLNAFKILACSNDWWAKSCTSVPAIYPHNHLISSEADHWKSCKY